MALWGEPGAMMVCIHLPLITSHANKHNILYVLSVQTTVWLHEQVNGNLCRYVMKAGM